MTAIDDREYPFLPVTGSERELLTGFLDFYRTVLVKLCSDLDDTQLRTRSISSADLTLLGILRHMSYVENVWFQQLFLSGSDRSRFEYDDDPDGDFHHLDDAATSEVLADFDFNCSESRMITELHDLADLSGTARHGHRVSLRWILIHMIEEYARHCGHADLIREAIDGRTAV